MVHIVRYRLAAGGARQSDPSMLRPEPNTSRPEPPHLARMPVLIAEFGMANVGKDFIDVREKRGNI